MLNPLKTSPGLPLPQGRLASGEHFWYGQCLLSFVGDLTWLLAFDGCWTHTRVGPSAGKLSGLDQRAAMHSPL